MCIFLVFNTGLSYNDSMSSKANSEVKTHHAIVVSISYATIDAFLVEYPHNGKPKIEVHKSSHVPGLFSGGDLTILEREVLSLETLSRVLHELLPEVHTRAPKKIICMLGEPWITSSVRTVTISKPKPTPITKEMLDRALESDYRGMMATLSKEHADVEPLSVVDRKIVSLSLDGYSVSSPVGKKAMNVSEQLYVSLAPEAILTKIKDSISTVFPGAETDFIAEQFVSWYGSSSSFEEPVTLMRIGYDVTDIIVCDRESGIRAVGHVPYGVREWYEGFATIVGVLHPRHIRSLMHLYATERLNKKTETRVEHMIRLLSKASMRAFDHLFGLVLEQDHLAQTIFVSSEVTWEPFLCHLLREDQFLRDTLGFPPRIVTTHMLPGATGVTWNDGKHHSHKSLLLKALGEIYFS
jgi:hypothetical protein